MKSIILPIITVLILMAGCCSDNNPDRNQNKFTEQSTELVQIKLNEDLIIEPLQNSVYLITHSFPWPANSLLIQTENNSAILIDTPYTPEATEKVTNWVEDKLNINRFSTINTHFHVDNLGGNSFLIQEGYPVYSSDLSITQLDVRGEKHLNQIIKWVQNEENRKYLNTYESLNLTPPDNIFPISQSGETLIKTIYKEEVEIFFPGEGHTKDNLSVFIPSRNILFGGCLIKGTDTKNLGNLADGNSDEYINSVNRLLTRYGETKDLMVIPGHGIHGGVELINHTISLCNIEN